MSDKTDSVYEDIDLDLVLKDMHRIMLNDRGIGSYKDGENMIEDIDNG